MSVSRRHIRAGAVAPSKLHPSVLQGLYAYEKFNYQPVLTKAAGYGDPTGATGNENLAIFKAMSAAYHVKGAGQTLLGPLLTAAVGLDVSQDQVNAEGVEYLFGALQGIPNPFRYIVGTSKPVMARLKLTIPDVSGAAELAFGFREIEAFTANLDDYTDLACINVQAGVVRTETILNNAATVTVTTSKVATDGQQIELKVILVGRTIRYFFNGQELIQAPTQFLFTNALALAPFFFFLQAADLTPIYWDEFEIGYLDDLYDNRVSGF